MILRYTQDGKTATTLKFPKTESGMVSEIKAFVENMLAHHIELKPDIRDPDVKLLNYPKELEGGKSGPILLRFEPKTDREIPLSDVLKFRIEIG